VLGGRWAAPPWRSAVRPWLKAAACEFGRSHVPWSRCALFPVDVMIEPVAASAAPPERLELRSPHTSVLLHSASLQRAGFPSRLGPPTDWPRLQSAGGASGERPYAAGDAWAGSDNPAHGAKPIPSMNPFDLLRPRGLPIRVRSSYVSEWMCRPRSRRFDSCAPCRDHRACCVWSPRARERHSPRPAREVRAGVIWQRAGRVAVGARHWSGQLLQPAGRTPARLWPPAFGRTPSRRTTQPWQPDRALPKMGASAWP